MKHNSINRESGQAIIYLTLGIVVFFGFVALAIDGGMALADRRNTQNVADASSLAGGAEAASLLETSNVTINDWNCNTDVRITSSLTHAVDSAIARAAANNISIDDDPSDHNGVTAECGTTDYGWYVDQYIDVTVEISATTQSNFLQIFFPSALHNEVVATTRIRPRQPLAFGNAIVSLNPDNNCGPNTDFGAHGTGDLIVENGGIFSNGCIYGNGTANVTVIGAPINGHTLSLGGSWSPTPHTTSFVLPSAIYEIPAPDCNDPAAHHVSGDLPKPNVPAGLYCVTGGLNLKKDYTGSDITIVILSGDVKINGNANVDLSAPSAAAGSPAVAGLLWYIPPSNPTTFRMNGNAYVKFVGTLLAPTSSISLLGTNDFFSYQTQIIGWNVDIGGTAQAYVSYNGSQQLTNPTSLELFK